MEGARVRNPLPPFQGLGIFVLITMWNSLCAIIAAWLDSSKRSRVVHFFLFTGRNSVRTEIAAWLNASQRSRVEQVCQGWGCKALWAIQWTGYCAMILYKHRKKCYWIRYSYWSEWIFTQFRSCFWNDSQRFGYSLLVESKIHSI